MTKEEITKSIEDVYEFGVKSDVFSLGLVLYDAYFICVLGYDFDKIPRKINSMKQQIPEISKRNKEFAEILEQITIENPKERKTFADIL